MTRNNYKIVKLDKKYGEKKVPDRKDSPEHPEHQKFRHEQITNNVKSYRRCT